jgi:outer membrane protein insertion porin family
MRLRRAAAGWVLAVLSLLPATLRADEPPAPVVRAIEIEGAVAFSRADVLRALRVKVGAPLRRSPDVLAALLKDRYQLRGLPAADVKARFDESTGTLAIAVDEGRIASVEIEGLGEQDSARVREALGLEPGTVLRDDEVASGLRRLRNLSEGAFDTVGEPPYEFERSGDGVRVRLKLRRRTGAVGLILFNSLSPAPIYSRVEGWTPSLGADLTLFDHQGFNHLSAYALAGYGFSSDHARFAIGARKPVGPHRLVTLGYEFHDLTDTDDVFRIFGVESWPGTGIYFEAFQDFYERRGHEAYAFARPSPRLHLGVSFRADEYTSLPVVSGDAERWPNPRIDDGDMRSLLFTARWAWDDALYAEWPLEKNAYLMRSLQGDFFQRYQGIRAEATLEVADDALGGDFTFTRLTGQLRGAHRLSTYHTLFGRVLFGVGSNTLPAQRRFALGGMGTLRGRDTKAFAGGDSQLMLTVEHAFEPAGPWPALIGFYDGGRIAIDGAGSGWKNDLGVGLAWPPNGRRLGRIDVGFALNREPGEPTARVTGHILLPF